MMQKRQSKFHYILMFTLTGALWVCGALARGVDYESRHIDILYSVQAAGLYGGSVNSSDSTKASNGRQRATSGTGHISATVRGGEALRLHLGFPVYYDYVRFTTADRGIWYRLHDGNANNDQAFRVTLVHLMGRKQLRCR